jgi:hypothetical protein
MKSLAWIACAAALVLLSGCRPSGKGGENATLRRLNVVLVTIDTLRADRLGCYGSRNVATPNLDRLAQGGALFENAVTPTPLTAPSHASIFTGTYPTVHKVRDTGGFVLQGSNPTLAEILQRQGWATAAFVGASVLKKGFGFAQGVHTGPRNRLGRVLDHVQSLANFHSHLRQVLFEQSAAAFTST